jgi:hypothetical protein
MLGCWLAVSPFVFRHAAAERWLWANDFACACAVVALALLSYWPPLRHAHLALGGVALWLMGFGYFAAPHPLAPALQNDLLIGLLLALFAFIPNEANLPPPAWREFYESESAARGTRPAGS